MFTMKKSLLTLAVVMSALIYNAPTAAAADGITPYANLTMWTAWAHRTAELGEATILVAELEKGYRSRIDYQTDVTSTASSFIGIMGEKNNLSMKAEVGVYPFTTKGAPALTIRYFYGAYRFGEFELRGGYDMAPYEAINRNDVCDGEAFADAALFESFQPQLRLSARGAYFQIMRSVINNEALFLDSGLVGVVVPTLTSNTKSIIPKFALGYTYTAENFSLGAHGIFQTYSIDETKSKNDGESITAAVGSVAMTGTFGPISLNISGFAGQNPGELGIFTNNNKNGNYIPFHPAANNKAQMDTFFNIFNTFGYGFSASGGYKIGILQINAGFAYDCDQNKIFKKLPQWESDKDDSKAAFVDMIFSIAPNLRLSTI
jgi:hypothetical protein